MMENNETNPTIVVSPSYNYGQATTLMPTHIAGLCLWNW